MLKIYGMRICPDCEACLHDLDQAGVVYEFLDFAQATENLKAFLKLRQDSPLFDPVRAAGNIGIPCIQREDGSLTLDWQEFVGEQA